MISKVVSTVIMLFYAMTGLTNAPVDAGTLITNGGNCSRRTATWTHGGDYELYVLPVTAPVCSSLPGAPFEHPYFLHSTEWDYSLGVWIEVYDNEIQYPVSHCHEMPGGIGWGGQQMIIRHVRSGALYFKPVDNPAPGWKCERVWLPRISK